MWFYLFGRNDRYPDPVAEIETLADLGERGEDVFLKLSPRDDAPLNGGAEGGFDSHMEGSSPLDRLTAAMDAAWDQGRVTAEAIDVAVRKFREGHPYGR